MSQVTAKPNARERRLWEAALSALADQIEGWCKEEKWAFARQPVTLHETQLGTYKAETLQIKAPSGLLIVEPIARDLQGGGDGRVDIYSMGVFRRMLLIRHGSTWSLFTDDRVPWPLPWKKDTFIKLAEAITSP